MGETQRHIVTHHLSPELRDLLHAIVPDPDVSIDDPTPAQPRLEPWTFYSPVHQRDVYAFVDDTQQVRHVPVDRCNDVPKAWRQIYLGDPS